MTNYPPTEYTDTQRAIGHMSGALPLRTLHPGGDTPMRLFLDTIGLLMIAGLCWIGWVAL